MTVLTFTGPAATAAAEIITGTSLQHNWPHAIGPVVDEDSYRVVVDDEWRWSGGEFWLIQLLQQISRGHGVDYVLHRVEERCDETTYGVCLAAVESMTADAP